MEPRWQGAQAAYDATVAAYRQTVLAAFQEVEDDLANLRYLAEEAVQQQDSRYGRTGVAESGTGPVQGGNRFLSERHRNSDHALKRPVDRHRILQRRMSAAVDLVKALGGGWDASTLPSGDALRTVSLADPKNTQNVARPPVNKLVSTST